jgi:hypothetical protein
VQTTPYAGAECQLVNEKGSWNIPASPGSTTIARAYGDMVVTCTHKNGTKGSTAVQSTTVGSTFGNILVGGLIGAAVDMSSGAAYQYPSTITIALTPTQGGSEAQGQQSTQPAAVKQRPSMTEVTVRLKQLLDLREQKLIPEEEYQRRVKEIVDEL